MQMDSSIQSTITATILGLAAQIEREFISKRTKEALLLIASFGTLIPKNFEKYYF